MMNACPCGTGLAYEECCGPIIDGTKSASSAEQLMRSRYTAYAKKVIGYLYSSLHPEQRKDYDEKSTRQWAESSQWHNLEILDTRGGGQTEGFMFQLSKEETGIWKSQIVMTKKERRMYEVSGK